MPGRGDGAPARTGREQGEPKRQQDGIDRLPRGLVSKRRPTQDECRDTTVDQLADELAVDPDDIRVVLREHDVYADDLSDANAWDVRLALDPGGERSRHVSPPEKRFGLGSPHSPTAPD